MYIWGFLVMDERNICPVNVPVRADGYRMVSDARLLASEKENGWKCLFVRFH